MNIAQLLYTLALLVSIMHTNISVSAADIRDNDPDHVTLNRELYQLCKMPIAADKPADDLHVTLQATRLLEINADPNADTPDGPVLHAAILHGKTNIAIALICGKAAIHNHNIAFGGTPLHIAAQQGNVVIARLLLDNSASINELGGNNGRAPLHLAALCDRKEMIQLLSMRNANMDVLSEHGLTPLQLAAKERKYEITELLVSRNANIDAPMRITQKTALHLAIETKNDLMASFLLNTKADPNKRTTQGETALHIAARLHQHVILSTLVDSKADIDAHIERTREVIHNNKVVYTYTEQEGTSLHIAIQKGDNHTIQFLLGRNADADVHAEGKTQLYDDGQNIRIDAEDCMGTPLHTAIRHNNLAAVKLLIAAKADLEKPDSDGHKPLSYACDNILRRPNLQIVRTLALAGADHSYMNIATLPSDLQAAIRNAHIAAVP